MLTLPFQIKICGLTDFDDARQVGELRVDAIGLNFSQHSVRTVGPDQAKELADVYRRARGDSASVVGVFVEQNVAQANQIASQVGLDFIQLHGDHSHWDIQHANRPVIWVERIGASDIQQMQQQISDAVARLQPWFASGSDAGTVAAVLLDAHVPGQWGGTGKSLAWEPLADRHQWGVSEGATAWPHGLPLILAGGIRPENVAQAIKQARPEAVDVASGVEQERGRKSATLIRALLDAAKFPQH